MSELKEGIVLRTTPYGESRIILNLLSPDQGTFGLIASISKTGKSGLKKAHFQSLQILEVKYAERNKGDLKRLQDARILHSYQHLYFDPIRSCLSLFLAEFLSKVLREEEAQPELYYFIKDALLQLDATEVSPANFHLAFLMELSDYLGCRPDLSGKETLFFDLMNGACAQMAPDHPYFIEAEELALWREIQAKGMQNWTEINLRGSKARRAVLNSLIDYYRLQLHDFGSLKSLQVLREVLA